MHFLKLLFCNVSNRMIKVMILVETREDLIDSGYEIFEYLKMLYFAYLSLLNYGFIIE